MRLRAIIATAAVAVLVIGYALRPQAELPPPAIEQEPSPILREVVERREAVSIYAALQQTARNVAAVSARVVPAATPPERWSDWQPDPPARVRFGVVTGPVTLVADAADLPDGAVVEATLGTGGVVSGVVAARYPAAGLAMVTLLAAEPVPVPSVSTAPPQAGEPVVAVAPGEDGLLILPLVISEVRRSGLLLSGALERHRGLPVFNTRNEWLGVIADGEDGPRVVDPTNLPVEPEEPAGPEPLGLSLRLGMADAGPRPIVVEAVAPDGRAAAAGLQPDDVVVSIDGVELLELETAVEALRGAGEAPVSLTVRRDRRTVTIRLGGETATP